MLNHKTKRLISKALKNYGNRHRTDKLEFPLWSKSRCIGEEDGYREYGFIEFDDDMSDTDIQEWFEDCVVMRICSPYDCTGRPFTFTLDWHRNPNGLVSFVHHVLMDY